MQTLNIPPPLDSCKHLVLKLHRDQEKDHEWLEGITRFSSCSFTLVFMQKNMTVVLKESDFTIDEAMDHLPAVSGIPVQQALTCGG